MKEIPKVCEIIMDFVENTFVSTPRTVGCVLYNEGAIILNDNNGTASIEIGAYGVPESFILNKEKKIIKKIIGPIDKKKFYQIKELIKNEN